jgi:hypothetical protein
MSDPSGVGGALAKAALQGLPPEIRGVLDPKLKTGDRIKSAIGWAARPDPNVVRRHHQLNSSINGFTDVRNAKLEHMDAVARGVAADYRRRGALTGAVTGLPGGAWAVLAAGADIQLTAIYAVRMVADIAQSYGYNTMDVTEQAELANVLAVAAGMDTLRGIGNVVTREGMQHLLPEILPRLVVKLSAKLTEEQAAKWVGRIIPGVGAIVGGSIDYTILRVAGQRAVEHYHARYLNEHALTGAAAVAALPPGPQSDVIAPGASVVDALPADATSSVAAPAADVAVPAAPEHSLPPSPAGTIHIQGTETHPAPRRSAVAAVLFEIVIPGSGAIYAGHGAMGIIWLLASVLAAAVALPTIVALVNSVTHAINTATLPAWSSLPTTFIIVAGVWLLLRMLLAGRYAATYSQRYLRHAPERLLAGRLATFAVLSLLGTAAICGGAIYLIAQWAGGLFH